MALILLSQWELRYSLRSNHMIDNKYVPQKLCVFFSEETTSRWEFGKFPIIVQRLKIYQIAIG